MDKPITLCDRCSFAVSCLLNYDGIPCRKHRTVEPTNADRIRAKSDEELAEWLERIRQCCTTQSCRISSDRQCPLAEVCYSNKETLDWLQQEAGE